MDALSVEGWSKGAREVASLDALQQERVSPGVMEERGSQHPLEESRYDCGLALVDSVGDPRAWLAEASGTCAARATSQHHLRHSPCPSTGSYQGEDTCAHLCGFLPAGKVSFLKQSLDLSINSVLNNFLWFKEGGNASQ